MIRSLSLLCIKLVILVSHACAIEHVTFKRDDREHHVSGKIEVEAQDGGILILASDGTMHAIQPDEIVKRSSDEIPFKPLTSDALGKQLISSLPAGFKLHTTSHYVICYNTSPAYADWCGALFERLYRAFTNFWSRKGFELREPEFPLVAIVFADRDAYLNYAKDELGNSAEAIVAYYNMQNNRIAMYDLTGVEALRLPGGSRGSAAQINRMLAQPEAESAVATIIHEATHQIAFNSGLQTRFADIPLWVSEGLAVYFETPDLQSAKGWRNIGAVNRPRLDRFREYEVVAGTILSRTLIADDKRIRDPRHALDAYAEAWAFNYFLLRQKPREYLQYLKVLAQKKPMVYADSQTRIEEFQTVFGKDMAKLDLEFLKNIQKIK